ncbi:MAG: hypothetical protein O7F08_09030, partial [Deltaproteobacteria bacterium]|nr:hypothetical protein [Deltaproteobacteria bacterium]
MAVSEEKLSELEEALAELGKDDDEVSAVLRRFEGGQRMDLAAVDSELDALGDGASLPPKDERESDTTEVEIIDPDDDFVFLVDEDD